MLGESAVGPKLHNFTYIFTIYSYIAFNKLLLHCWWMSASAINFRGVVHKLVYIYIYELIASFLEIYSYKLDGQILSWTENKIQLKSRTLLIVCQYHESNIFFNGKHSICNNDCSLSGYVKLYIAICSFLIGHNKKIYIKTWKLKKIYNNYI